MIPRSRQVAGGGNRPTNTMVMRFAMPLVLVAAVLTAGAAHAAALPRADRARATVSAQQISQVPGLQAEVLAAINELRLSKGLSEVRLNSALSRAALGHSLSMAEHGFFSHSGWNGSPFWQRIKAKYKPLPSSHWSVGENMVWASTGLSAGQAIEMWLASPPHRKNLLAPGWREVGLGAVRALAAPGVYAGLDVTILTADFGVR
jgi:uncharacterized protein YkwD